MHAIVLAFEMDEEGHRYAGGPAAAPRAMVIPAWRLQLHASLNSSGQWASRPLLQETLRDFQCRWQSKQGLVRPVVMDCSSHRSMDRAYGSVRFSPICRSSMISRLTLVSRNSVKLARSVRKTAPVEQSISVSAVGKESIFPTIPARLSGTTITRNANDTGLKLACHAHAASPYARSTSLQDGCMRPRKSHRRKDWPLDS